MNVVWEFIFLTIRFGGRVKVCFRIPSPHARRGVTSSPHTFPGFVVFANVMSRGRSGRFFLIVFPFPIKQHTRRNTRGDDQNLDYITLIRVMRSAITML